MLIVCVHTVVTAGNVYNLTGAQIDVPAEEASRLLQLHAAKLPGAPDPGPLFQQKYPDREPGIYSLPVPSPSW